MPDSNGPLLYGRERSNWIRLRTLILLRWVAIIGQLTAIVVAAQIYHLQLRTGECFLAVGVSVIGNLIAIFVFPENKRLTESENLLMVLFDLLQLSFLLYLTGGLHNPFAMLLLGPVTISASVLGLRSTILVGGAAICLVTMLAKFHLPLVVDDGSELELPQLFVFGNWAAITIAVLFMGAYSRRVSSEMHSMADALAATQMALAREQKLTDLGGVVAAAAHELGTPLATIRLISGELMDALSDPEQAEDARVIREQTDRCRAILRSMGQAGKDDLHMRHAPLQAVLADAAAPHTDRGPQVHFDMLGTAGSMPEIQRRPEILHGLRNLIQNAVDFAQGHVWIEAGWTDTRIHLRVIDDGAGYPPNLLDRIGEPYLRDRRADDARNDPRPGYEGMGLGLFIAKTLLERTGATVRFDNCTNPDRLPRGFAGPRCGAMAEVTWPRRAIEADARRALGENAQIDNDP